MKYATKIASVFSILMITMSAYALEPGNRTIVTFGDSTTALRTGIEKVYSDVLREELPKSGITGSVINKGIGGNNTNDAMARFQTDVLNLNPDLVIMQFGINDQAVDLWKNPPATTSRVSLTQYRSNLTYMVQTLQAAGSEVILMTPNPILWNDVYLDYYGGLPYDVNDRMGFNVLLTDYAQAMREVAAAEQVPLLDVYNIYLAYDQVPGQQMDDWLLDGMHPNDTGHRMVGDALEEMIVPEPATMSLLGIGGGVCLIKRRKVAKRIS